MHLSIRGRSGRDRVRAPARARPAFRGLRRRGHGEHAAESAAPRASAGAGAAASAARTALNWSGKSRGQACRPAGAAAATSISRTTTAPGRSLPETRARTRPGSCRATPPRRARGYGGEAGQQVVVGEVGGPAIGGEDGAVEVIVQPPQHANEAAVVNAALGLGQRLIGAQFRQGG